MKIVSVSTSDLRGGAARAAYRLCAGMRAAGAEAHMLVQDKSSDDSWVRGPEGKLEKGLASLRPTLDQLPLWITGSIQRPVSLAWALDGVTRALKVWQPDIVHLNSWDKGFMRIGALQRLQQPIVWTMHDMWPFTGGCHYDAGCGRYVQMCGMCPQLDSRSEYDLSLWVWRRKQRVYRQIPLFLVSPSRWLAECAARSSLFADRDVRVIPYGIDVGLFRPVNRRQARDWLRLPQEKKLILFSGMNAVTNPLKGFHLLQKSLSYLAEMSWRDQVELLVLGSPASVLPVDLPFPVNCWGRVHDEITLALINGAVDVVVIPSLMDNLPNTAIEALSCGTPVVGFGVGGIPELVEHQTNGFLADPLDVQGLAVGIDWVLSDVQRWESLSTQARSKAAANFDQIKIAHRYLSYFEEILVESLGVK